MELFVKIACLGVAVILHELSHGLVAYAFGDPTAKNSGRLSLNPLKHIDPLGSVILPVLLFVTNAPFLIGWAKPVPVNFKRLRPQGVFLVAFAGPLMNILLALIASILWKNGIFASNLAIATIQINVILAAFNLLPILPLDGGRMITFFLPQDHKIFLFFERFGFFIVIASLMFLSSQMHAVISKISNYILMFIDMLVL